MDHPLGLYSESEKQEWRQLQAMPAYKEALINEVERGTCASMQSCPYAKGGMAAAAGGFDLGSLTPELPGASLINQLLNPWNWLNMASMLMSTVNLFLYLRLQRQSITAAGGTNVGVKVQNLPITKAPFTPAAERHIRPGKQAPLYLYFEGNPGSSLRSFA